MLRQIKVLLNVMSSGKPASKTGVKIEPLEQRRLFSDTVFLPPVTSALPTGFQFQKLLTPSLNTEFEPMTDLVATSTSGGGLWLVPDGQDGYRVAQQLNTTATILGLANTGITIPQSVGEITNAEGIYTTAGLMLPVSGQAFGAPGGLAYPSDAVPGAYVIQRFRPNDASPELTVERYTPNSATPGRGTVIMAVFPVKSDGTFGSEIDTTLGTDLAPDSGAAQIPTGDFNLDGQIDIVAAGAVWLGNGDGTFNAAKPIQLPSSPTGGNYYAGDFNSDSRTDLLQFPVSSTGTEQAQVLLSNGDGTFRVAGSYKFGPSGTTQGAPLIADFTADYINDVAIQIVGGNQAPAVSIVPSDGQGNFYTPDVLSTPSFLQVVTIDFDANTRPDLVGVSSSGPGNYSLVCFDNQTPAGPVVRLTATPDPVVAGQSVTLTAAASNPVNPLNNGTMEFFDGGKMLGQASVVNGVAVFSTSKLSAGTHSLTASFSGSGFSVSLPISETVNAAPLQAPLLSALQLSHVSHGAAIPGAKENLRLVLSNLGGAAASATVGVQLFATSAGSIDANSISIPVSSLESRNVHVAGNGKTSLDATYTLPESLPQGTYYLTARLTPLDGILASQVINSTVVDPASINVLWEFGDVNNHKNVVMVRHLSNGQIVTFKLSGQANGTLAEGASAALAGTANPDYSVVVNTYLGTENLTISQTGGTQSNIASLTILGPLNSCDVRTDTPFSIRPGPTNSSSDASVARLSIGTIPRATVSGINVAGNLEINNNVEQFQAQALNGASISLNEFSAGKLPLSMKVQDIDANSVITSGGQISLLSVDHAALGATISAPAIIKISSAKDFDATLDVTGATKGASILGAVDIGGSVAGTIDAPIRWSVNGNIGDVRIAGDVSHLQVLGGALLGADGELASPPATYSGTLIKSFDVNGSVTSSLISAGLDPVDGILLNGNDTLLDGGAIDSITIKGLASNDSRFLAASLPPQAKIDSITVVPSQDPRFALT